MVLAGCSSRPVAPPPVAPEIREQCRLPAAPAQHSETLSVVLTEPVELGHALSPTNDSERLLFRLMLPSLVRLDCAGNVHPELAETWQRSADGLEWTFTLRQGVRSLGMPVTAAHVLGRFGQPDAVALGIDSAVYLDDRHLRVRLRAFRDTVPRLFAEPGLAVLSGLTSAGGPVRRLIVSDSGRPAVDFQVVDKGDPRDAIDRGIDLVVTRDPSIVEYVAGRPELETYPLPWSRTYLLLQPAGAPPLNVVDDSVRRSLARDAVRAEARPAEPPFWWDSLAACVPIPDSANQQLTASRIAYRRDDRVARSLAERLVALGGTGISLRAAALDPAEFAAALREGTERAFVVAAPRQSLAPCHDAASWPSAAAIRPLIDTRARAIVRRGSPGLMVDWDGTVRVLP